MIPSPMRQHENNTWYGEGVFLSWLWLRTVCRKAWDFRVLVFLIVAFPGSSTAIALKTL